MSELPTQASVVLVYDTATKSFLLIRRTNKDEDVWAGNYALPGGHIEPGETPLTAATRELAEETGIEIANTGKLDYAGIFETTKDEYPGYPSVRIHIYLLFVDDRPRTQSDREEVDELIWVSESPFRTSYNLSGTPKLIRSNGRTYPAVIHGSITVWGITLRIINQTLFQTERRKT